VTDYSNKVNTPSPFPSPLDAFGVSNSAPRFSGPLNTKSWLRQWIYTVSLISYRVRKVGTADLPRKRSQIDVTHQCPCWSWKNAGLLISNVKKYTKTFENVHLKCTPPPLRFLNTPLVTVSLSLRSIPLTGLNLEDCRMCCINKSLLLLLTNPTKVCQ